MSAIMRPCKYCGKLLPYSRKKFCTNDCRTDFYRMKENRVQYRETDEAKRIKLQGPVKLEPWQPKRKYVSPISDKEQMRINREIDSKHDAPLHYRHYKPGTPEFDSVAAQCTPPERIPVESYACFGIPDPGGRLFDERKN